MARNWLDCLDAGGLVAVGAAATAFVLGRMTLAAVDGVKPPVPANLGVVKAFVFATLGKHVPAHELVASMPVYRTSHDQLPMASTLPAQRLSESAAPQTGPAMPGFRQEKSPAERGFLSEQEPDQRITASSVRLPPL